MHEDEDPDEAAFFQDHGIPQDLLASLGVLDGSLEAVGLASSGVPNVWGVDDGIIGHDQGEDFEDDVDEEIKQEPDDDAPLGGPLQPLQPFALSQAQKRTGEVRESRPRKKQKAIVVPEKPRTIKDVWPMFEPGKVLNFTQMLQGKVTKKSRAHYQDMGYGPTLPPPKKAGLPPVIKLGAITFDAAQDLHSKFSDLSIVPPTIRMHSNPDTDLRKAIAARMAAKGDEFAADLPLNDRSYDLVNLSDWENQIVYSSSLINNRMQPPNLEQPINSALESGAWAKSIIWDAHTPFVEFTQLQLDDVEEPVASGNTPVVVAATAGKTDKDKDATTKRKRRRGAEAKAAPQPQPQQPQAIIALAKTHRGTDLKDKFNISNDRAYEISKERHRVRQTFGQLIVQHAYPALKLQLPFYKTRLSKSEARSFHRPALQFPSNIQLSFSKVRGAKKKKDKSGRKVSAAGGGDPSEALRRTSDITLKETGNFVLWEYSEEHPPVISNFGMGSILVNYYRKRDSKDDHVPKLDLGEPFILEPSDQSPFMKFGSVLPGQTIPALYNNLIRAPLFRHKPPPTDFLVVKSTINGQTKYYLREIKSLFVVGQTYPVTEVPGPHSRKITSTIKYRLQFIAYKLLRKVPEERLKISKLMKYFPDQNELQMRQRLKEFMEYHRKGPHQGFWRLKEGHEMLSDAKMHEYITPEHVVLSEGMQVGQRHLLDSGYGQAAANADEGGDDSKLDIEQQLAPWMTTKNFLNATAAKAMLKLHGAGDPTGRGEAFSFIRVSMKEIFVRAGEDAEEKQAEADSRPKHAHRYNVAQQQVVYRSEIDRIWKAQYDSLINKAPPELSDDEDNPQGRRNMLTSARDRMKRGMSVRTDDDREDSPMFIDSPRASPAPGGYSRAGSIGREEEGPASNRVLKIQRKVNDEWHTEIIRDPNVISAYMKRREELEVNNMSVDDIRPTGDAAKDASLRKKLVEDLARMQKNQERRLQRKNAAIIQAGGDPISLGRPAKPDTSRRCGHCGQVGHMKTNQKCPKFAEFYGTKGRLTNPKAISPPATSPPPSTPDGGRSPYSSMPPPAVVPPYRQPFAYPPVPSPLATSPPLSAFGGGFSGGTMGRSASMASVASGSGSAGASGSGGGGPPKLKLSLRPPGSAASPPR